MRTIDLPQMMCPDCYTDSLEIEIDAIAIFNKQREQVDEAYSLDIFCTNTDLGCTYLNQVVDEVTMLHAKPLEEYDNEDEEFQSRTPMYEDHPPLHEVDDWETDEGLQSLFNMRNEI